ncbi:unnamed protein product, partial [Didymodactylos carnosus]
MIKLNSGQKDEPSKKYLNYSKRLRHLITHPHPTLLQQLHGLPSEKKEYDSASSCGKSETFSRG